MKSLLAQCAVAAFAAAVVNASVSMAQDPRPRIGAQLAALGLDRAEIRAKLEGLTRDDRIAYLQSLGVRLPDSVARPKATLSTGSALKVMPGAADGTAMVALLPTDGSVNIDAAVRPLQVRPGSVSNNGTVVIDPAAVNGAAGFTPAQPSAKP